MPATTTIRAAMPSDAPAIADLLGQLGYPTPPESVPPRMAAMDAQNGAVFVALDEDMRVVGLACCARNATLHAEGEVAYITALVTDASVRCRGVGRSLVTALEQWALAYGCARLTVTSAEHRSDAHAFYAKCGFPYTGRRFTRVLRRPSS